MTDIAGGMNRQGAQVGNAMPLLRIAEVSKRFGNFTAVDGVSLDIGAGEFFALLGPSGCGKTTLLRMLAGFEMPDGGAILLDGADIASVPPHLRPVNMMFQNYALFPHLSVENNIAFGLRRLALTQGEIAARVGEMIALVRLQGFEKRKPDQLSGGQRQRVALARALARRPRLLLLDEPLAALDKKLREETQAELMQLQRKLGTTFIIVTHDQDEAMTLASRIGVMDKGHLMQVGTPRDLYETPNSRWIASFVGDINMIEGRVSIVSGKDVTVETSVGTIIGCGAGQAAATVAVAIRPEKIRLTAGEDDAGAVNRKSGQLIEIGYLGGSSVYRIALDGGALVRVIRTNTARDDIAGLHAGQRVNISFAPHDCVVLDQ